MVRTRRSQARRGIALIPALLILSIVASSAVLLDLGQQVWIRQTENIRDRAQAGELANGVLMGALRTLGATRFVPATPEAMDAWAADSFVPTLDAPGASASVRIRSAQGLFNLNSLLRGGAASPDDVAVFGRLLVQAGLDVSLIDAVLDWMDADDDRRDRGAEDHEYLGQVNGYRAANRPFETVDELAQVRGFDAAAIEKLRPVLTALPEATAIDVNAAPPAVLKALFKDPASDLADRLVESRRRAPFLSAFDFNTRAGLPPTGTTSVATKSRYFLVRADGAVNRARRKTESLVSCPPALGAAQVIWRADVF